MKHTFACLLLCITISGCSKDSSIKSHEYAGQSSADPSTVTNGQIILFRKADVVGAISFTSQEHGRPDIAEYNWIYRDDGNALLDPLNQHVKQGHSKTVNSTVHVGDVRIEWSDADDSSGYVYYDYYPSQTPPDGALSLCITDLTLDDFPIDANSGTFVWRKKPEEQTPNQGMEPTSAEAQSVVPEG